MIRRWSKFLRSIRKMTPYHRANLAVWVLQLARLYPLRVSRYRWGAGRCDRPHNDYPGSYPQSEVHPLGPLPRRFFCNVRRKFFTPLMGCEPIRHRSFDWGWWALFGFILLALASRLFGLLNFHLDRIQTLHIIVLNEYKIRIILR